MMSDEILSQLGFDASGAISELRKLDKQFTSSDGSLGKFAQGLSAFNPIAAKTASGLQKLAADADTATTAIKNLSGAAKSLPATIAAPSLSAGGGSQVGGSTGGGAANAAAVTAQIEAIRAKFTALPQDASAASQRAYESAITQAAEFAVKTNASIGSVIQTQSNLGSSFTGTSNVMADKLAKVGQAFTRAFNDGSRDIRKLTIDYETFVRIISTQLVIRALRQIEEAFSNAVSSAAEFQTKVSQIRTISGDLGTSGIAESARKVSDAFNIPLIESANALYQTFSNQVGTTSESLQFFGETAKFAKGSVTEMKDAVDLISGVLNSFGLKADQTGNVAGKLFRTIELGRITGSELANSFGRVGPAAAQLGISLDDVLAALSVTTISGVKTSEAITQLRGVINAFSKPTQGMKAALQQLGYESAEDALQANNLGDILKKLNSTTDGTAASFAKLFPNVRGLNLAILLGKRDLGQYGDVLHQTAVAGAELNDEKFHIVIETDAQKAQGELNKLKNFLTVDFGEAFLKVVADFAKFSGGADNLILTVRNFTPILAAGGAVLTIYATKVAFLAARANLAGAALGNLSSVILGLGAAVAIGKGIGDIINSSVHDPINARTAAGEAQIKALQDSNAKELEIVQKTNEAKVAAGLETLTKLRAQYYQDVDNAQAAYKQLEAATTRSFGKIVSAREQLVGELKRQEEHARESQIDSQYRVADLVAASDDRSFERRTRNLGDIRKSYALNERAAKFAADAQKRLLANPQDPKEQERALRLFEKAGDLASQSEEIGKRAGNRTLEYRAAETLNSITKRQIAAENELTKIQAARQAALGKEREKQEAIVEDLKKQVKIFSDNSGDFDKKGNPFSQEEQAKRDKARQAAGKKIIDSALGQKDLKTLDILGLAKFASEFKSELTAKPIEVPLTFEKSLAALREETNKAFSGLNDKVPGKKGLEEVVGRTLNTPDEIAKGAKEAADNLQAMEEQLHKVGESSQAIGIVRDQIQAIVDESKNSKLQAATRLLGNSFGDPGTFKKAKDNLASLQDDIAATAKNPNIQQSDFNRLLGKYGQLQKDSNAGVHGNGGFRQDVEVLGEALLKLKQIADEQAALANNPAAQSFTELEQKAEAIRTALSNLNSDPLAAAADALAKGMGSAASSAGTAASNSATFKSNLEGAAAAAERAAAAMARSQAAGAGGGGEGDSGEGFFNGGMVKPKYFATGGPVGQDRIAAYLAPRETVMNQQATSKWYSQLSSMNAGHAPPATTHVGDTSIHAPITINESKTPAATATAVVSELRRAFRSGGARRF